jgi:hypothetical protein
MKATLHGYMPMGMVATTEFVEVSMIETALLYTSVT